MTDPNQPSAESSATGTIPPRICVGQFAGAHGVRGLVRLRSFTEQPDAIAKYGPLQDQAGRRNFAFRIVGRSSDTLTVSVDGVVDRDQAQELAGVKLFVLRDRLPDPEDEDEFYHADLMGCLAVTTDGSALGRVLAIHDFGAGEMLEIGGAGHASMMVPFTRSSVPEISIAARLVVINPPIGIGPKDADLDRRAEEERS